MHQPDSSLILRVQQINSCYGDLQILWDVSFDVRAKKITTVIGSNGAGENDHSKIHLRTCKTPVGKDLFQGTRHILDEAV